MFNLLFLNLLFNSITMFKLILLKELKEIIQSNRFVISFAVCSVLIILAFLMGAQNYLASQAQYEATIQENRAQIAANTEWYNINHTITLPPQPLMALVNGVSSDIGRNIEMRSRGELIAENTRFNDEPLFAIFRFLDLEFIFGIVLSLFAIIFAYDAINGERTSGTLKLCFSNSISRASFIAGKFTGSFLGLSAALLIPILIGAALLPVLGIELTSDEWLRLTFIVFSGLAYFGVFLTLAIGISSITRRPSTSFLLSLVVWIFAVLIIPRSSVMIAGRMVDVPNLDEIASQKNNYRIQLFDEDRPKLQNFSIPKGTPPAKAFPLFSKFMGELSEKRQDKIEALEERLNEELENKKREQQKLAFSIARISPAAVFTFAVSRLAGTSLDLQHRFNDSAKEYQKLYSNFMEEKTGKSSGGIRIIVSDSDEQEEKKNLDPDEMPAFNFSETSFKETANSSFTDIGLLLLFNLVFFGGAFASFLRYDLR